METIPNQLKKIKQLFDLKKYQLAIDLFNADSRLMEDAKALFHTGRCYIRLQQREHALFLFEKALSIDANYGAVLLELAKYHMPMNVDKAKGFVQKCLLLDPNEPAYWGVQGSIYYGEKNFARAEDAFRKSMALKPHDVKTISNIGACLSEQKRFQSALEFYLLAVKTDPTYINGHTNLGMCYLDLNQLDEAEAIFLNILPKAPNYSTLHYGLACLYAKKNEDAKALQYLKHSIKINNYFKQKAKTDKDFEQLRIHPEFIHLTTD